MIDPTTLSKLTHQVDNK